MLLHWPVREEETGEVLGIVTGILLEPDTGAVEGFFVSVRSGVLGAHSLFLSSLDVRRLTNAFVVRSSDALAPAEEIIRVQELLRDPRTVLGQKIRTVSGASLGRCFDVQFDTLHFRIEWLFPKKWFREGLPISVTDIVEVKPDAIIIRDPQVAIKEKTKSEAKAMLPRLPEVV